MENYARLFDRAADIMETHGKSLLMYVEESGRVCLKGAMYYAAQGTVPEANIVRGRSWPMQPMNHLVRNWDHPALGILRDACRIALDYRTPPKDRDQYYNLYAIRFDEEHCIAMLRYCAMKERASTLERTNLRERATTH